ncbi:MAG: prepilin-type N-terminal cleavage/methylation domain-containing protein, partial [Synergistaceae bacterium]|nr:prepilin-type N-terminal cleavage/methylation domain-containing protein [Synergistaceae bacterium]
MFTLISKKDISKGFTLIELLIVLIVVGVLAGIIMVASN